jgi:phage-related protein
MATFANQVDLSGFAKQGSGIDQQGTLAARNLDPVVTHTVLKVNKT